VWTESNVFAAIWYNSIVRKTGGLKDTVIDFGDNGNGISHDQSSVGDICYSIQRAINLYKDKEHLNALQYRNEYRSFLGKSMSRIYRGYNLIINKNNES
jgi:starch synthase